MPIKFELRYTDDLVIRNASVHAKVKKFLCLTHSCFSVRHCYFFIGVHKEKITNLSAGCGKVKDLMHSLLNSKLRVGFFNCFSGFLHEK